jgi:hypothetical protein
VQCLVIKLALCVNKTEDVQFNVYIYLTVTKQISSSLRLRLQDNDTRVYHVLSSSSFHYM